MSTRYLCPCRNTGSQRSACSLLCPQHLRSRPVRKGLGGAVGTCEQTKAHPQGLCHTTEAQAKITGLGFCPQQIPHSSCGQQRIPRASFSRGRGLAGRFSGFLFQICAILVKPHRPLSLRLSTVKEGGSHLCLALCWQDEGAAIGESWGGWYARILCPARCTVSGWCGSPRTHISVHPAEPETSSIWHKQTEGFLLRMWGVTRKPRS